MSLDPTHDELAAWLSGKSYLSENCHDANFSGALGKVVDGALNAHQEKALLNHTDIPPFGTTVYNYGTRSFVGALSIGKTKVALKYYHRLNLRRQTGYTMFGSRAMKSWIGSRVFEKLGISSPKPIALFENRRFGFLIDRCLLVTEVAEGIPLPAYLRQNSKDEEKMNRVAENCQKIFDRLSEYRIYHSDTAAKNFVISPDGDVSIIDLDATRILVPPVLWKSKRASDKRLFLGIFNHYPHLQKTFSDIFKNDGVAHSRKDHIN